MLYQVLGSLEAMVGAGEAEMLGGIFPKARKIARGEQDWHTTELIAMGFMANKVHGIHYIHVVDVVSSTGVATGKGWPVGC